MYKYSRYYYDYDYDYDYYYKKLQKFINFCLKVGDSANLKHSKSTWRQRIVLWKVQNHNIKRSGHAHHFFDRGAGAMDLPQLSFWYRALSCEPNNYKVCLHPSVTFAFRSAHNNSILTLRITHKLKRNLLIIVTERKLGPRRLFEQIRVLSLYVLSTKCFFFLLCALIKAWFYKDKDKDDLLNSAQFYMT